MGPFILQRDPGGMFHDNVLATDGIRRIVAPVQYFGNGNASLLSHWQVVR